MFEHEFLITADTKGRNIYQLGLAGERRRIVRLLAPDRRRLPVALAFDELRQVVYWIDFAAAKIVSRPLTLPSSIVRATVVYTAGMK